MTETAIHIEAKDCLAIPSQPEIGSIMHTLLNIEQTQVFHFSMNHDEELKEPIVEFDYRNREWRAGRYVGEVDFIHNGQPCKFSVKPRFGEMFLFRMLEEIFNIKIIPSLSKDHTKADWQHYIKRIVSFIWIHKLASSNKYGIPRVNHYPEHRGTTIKGKLNVRKSILPYYTTKEVISVNSEKKEYDIIARIIWQAHKILVREFGLGTFKIPDSANDALNHFSQVKDLNKYVSEFEFKSIKLKTIYQNWKEIVDFSWDIIKSKPFQNEQKANKNSFAFFIDMAEVWELYISSLLKKRLAPKGWILRSEILQAYPEKYFKRKLIPDIIFEKGNDVIVWDAKYKMMKWRNFDFDRGDFFQIHTYINYYQQNKSVKGGGLLYPISTSIDNQEKTISSTLFGNENTSFNTFFHADGIDLSFVNTQESKEFNIEMFNKMEIEFLKRVEILLQ